VAEKAKMMLQRNINNVTIDQQDAEWFGFIQESN
jgi:hypothetical protein